MSEPYYSDDLVQLYHGDCLDVLRTLPDASVDAVVTDPPAAIAFMGKAWDSDRGGRRQWVAWMTDVMTECCRVLKPGGHAFVWALPRTSHWTAWAIEDSGLVVRDCVVHLFGSGFPKSLAVDKAIDKRRDEDRAAVLSVTSRLAALAEVAGITRADVDAHMGTSDMGGWWLSRLPHRCACPSIANWVRLREFIPGARAPGLDDEVWRLNGRKGTPGEAWEQREVVGQGYRVRRDSTVQIVGLSDGEYDITAPATPDAERWQGWGTALKPASEHWWLARKPLSGTVAANVLAHGTGALNVDACRVPSATGQRPTMRAWENEPSRCASCAAPVELNARPTTPETRASTATNDAAPTTSVRGATSPAATSKTDTGCSDGTKAAGSSTSSSTAESGKKPTALSPRVTSSTTETTTPSTTASTTCNSCGAAITSPTTHVNRTSTPMDPARRLTTNGSTASANAGRWPSNVVLDESQAAALDVMSGPLVAGGNKDNRGRLHWAGVDGNRESVRDDTFSTYADDGLGASRYFYTAKASSEERIRLPSAGGTGRVAGTPAHTGRRCNVCGNQTVPKGGKPWPACGHEDWAAFQTEDKSTGHVSHPTVKPLSLMRWLVRLVTPPGGTCLEPFAGSGTTVEAAILEGFRCIAIEREADYLPLIVQRINRRRDPVAAVKASGEDQGLFDLLGGDVA